MGFRQLFKQSITKAYWWNARANFGDALAPLLLSRFAYLETQWSAIEQASIASIGSILDQIPAGWRGHIVGSGRLREKAELMFDPTEAKILALRGPLSARGIHGTYGLGDPGLLANELIDAQEKKWDLGIVPHWLDKELVGRFQKLIPSKFSCKVISPATDPLTVLKEISACKRVVTSSLHGMICADAFGIPRRVETCDRMNSEGGLFKFHDYSASIKCKLEIGKMMEPKRSNIDDVRFEIWDAYRELGRAYGKG